jgi:hypothetical protein
MGLFSPTVHQGSGRTTFWNSYPIMMCGKVVRCDPGSSWHNTGRAVDCGGCLKAMRRAA